MGNHLTSLRILLMPNKRKHVWLLKTISISSISVFLLLVNHLAMATPAYDITRVIEPADVSVKSFNNVGQGIGYSNRYIENTHTGRSEKSTDLWFYDGSTTHRIGLTDIDHTSSTGVQRSYYTALNEAGQVAGYSYKYIDHTYAGFSAWLYDGSTTHRIGLTDNSTGRRYNYPIALNEAGQVAGRSNSDAWFYDGSTTHRIGCIDGENCNTIGTTKSIYALNEAGQVFGHSRNDWDNPHSFAWLYDGETTRRMGLTDAEHTYSNGDQSSESPRLPHLGSGLLNEAGQAMGESDRYYNNDGSRTPPYSQSVWLYDGEITHRIGLTDAEHTGKDGLQYSSIRYEGFLNEAGQGVGSSRIYNGGSKISGSSNWFYDGSTTHKLGLTDARHTDRNGRGVSKVLGLNEAGQVLGFSYRFNDDGSINYGTTAWLYEGLTTHKLGLTDVNHSSPTTGNPYSSNAKAFNEAGQVIGYSYKVGGGKSPWFYDLSTDSIFDLTFLTPESCFGSSADYLSEDGIVLGTYWLHSNDSNGNLKRLYWWNMEDGFFDLGSLVDGGLEANGWEDLYDVSRMTPNGMIVGWGSTSDQWGRVKFLLTPQNETAQVSDPATAPVPEPATLLLFGTGLAGLAGSRLRKKKN